MQSRRVILAFLLVGAAVFAQGCVVAVVGAGAAGTVAYIKGDLQAVESADIDAVYGATKEALEHLGLKVTKDSKTGLSAVIVARDADDKKVTINLKATADKTTDLSIRVGIFGSKTRSNRIYQEIRDNLKQGDVS